MPNLSFHTAGAPSPAPMDKHIPIAPTSILHQETYNCGRQKKIADNALGRPVEGASMSVVELLINYYKPNRHALLAANESVDKIWSLSTSTNRWTKF